MIQFQNIPGATPLDPNEIEGLTPSDISTQQQLNQAEQQNIIRGEVWAFERNHKDILSEVFLKRLHVKMFGDVWRWAGKFRKTNKNIGVDWHQLPTELRKLFDDSKFWIENETYEWLELGARFHHRLVSIHPFPNGNGRLSRMMTDLVLHQHKQNRFTWGNRPDSGKIDSVGPLRERYITALREADQRKFKALMTFVVS